MALSKEDIRVWIRRYQTDLAAQTIHHERWRRNIRLFDTSYWDDLKATNNEIVPVNYTTTFITTLVSSVFARYPEWKVKAKRPGRFYKHADTMKIFMDQFNEESKFKELAIKCVVDAATCNIGWIEQGYFKSNEEPIAAPEEELDLIGRMKELLTKAGQDEDTKESAQLGELNQQKRPGSFYLTRRSPWDVIIPEGHFEYESMPYLMVLEHMTFEDFLRNPRYKNQTRVGTVQPSRTDHGLDKIKTSPYGPAAFFNPKAPLAAKQDMDRPVTLINIWDRRENQVFTISESADKVHEDPVDWPYYGEGFPQKPLQFNYVPEIPGDLDPKHNFYGFADVDPIFAQVLEKSDLRTQQSKIRKRATVKVFVQAGTTTESELNKHTSPDVEVIPVTNIQAIQVSQGIAIPPAVLQVEDRIDSDLSRDSGMSLLLADASQQGKIERATVANIAQEATSLKTNYKVDRIESWIKQIGLYQVGLFWQYLTPDEVSERLGQIPKQDEWIPLPPDPILAKKWIRDELKLSVETGSTKPLNVDVLERKQFGETIGIIQNIAPGLFNQLKRQFIARLMKKSNEPDLEQIILGALDQDEQQVADMENRLMLEGAPQVVSPNDDHEVHLKTHSKFQDNQIVAAHMQAHLIRLEELSASQTKGGQGARQKADTKSPAEVAQQGATKGIDLGGASLNLGPGSAQANA